MKILAQNPNSYLSPHTTELSRLGNQAVSVSIGDLANIPHGIVLLGIADDTGIKNVNGRVGAAAAPGAVRVKLYKQNLHTTSSPIYDLGDLLPAESIQETHAQAQKIIVAIHQAGHFPIILGGGHDLAAPEALAFLETHSQSPLAFLNLDAHLDLRDTSKNITSGSPWYIVSQSESFQKQKAELVEFGIQAQSNSDVLVGYAKKNKIKIHWLTELRKKSLLKIFSQELLRLAKKKQILVSIDLDGVRAAEAPGCSAPQVQGFSADEILEMARQAGTCKAVKSFGIYELSPPLDPSGVTTALVTQCIVQFLMGYAERQAKGKFGKASRLG